MGFVKYDVQDAVGIVTIDREKALNALNSDVLNDLEPINLSLRDFEKVNE